RKTKAIISGSLKELEKETSTVRSSFSIQFTVLLRRGFRQVFRNKFALSIRLFFSLLFSLILSAVYSNTNYGQKSIQDRTGVLFFVVMNQSFQALISTVNAFTVEKAIIIRERQVLLLFKKRCLYLYHILAYYSTKVMTALPADIAYPLVFSSVMYWSVNLHPTAAAFFIFIAVTMLTSLSAISFGLFIAALAPSVEAANVMASPLMILQVMFAGFYININNIPIWLRWLENISYVRWAFMAFAINEFSGEHFHCDQGAGKACLATGDQVQFSFIKKKKKIHLLLFKPLKRFLKIHY
ncbi:ATP-binding cassette superfamily, partial [Reticulomyxa filosa]